MTNRIIQAKGFTFVELIAVLLIVGVLTVVTTSRFTSSAAYELQATRDTLVAAFRSAQQLAMTRSAPVQLSTSSNQIDIRIDSDGNNTFDVSESVTMDGKRYPISIRTSQSLDPATFLFDRLGRTSAANLDLTQGSSSVLIAVSSNGHVE